MVVLIYFFFIEQLFEYLLFGFYKSRIYGFVVVVKVDLVI